jgi:2-polyprenyl-6-methoxyphenol hydroxylase-like FAD-dependent oxidoreductase
LTQGGLTNKTGLYEGWEGDKLLESTDVLIVGAGPAGTSVAAALSAIGLRTLIVDAGVDRTKQLAGEFIHPPGTLDLAALGFKPGLAAAGAQPVKGFAVVDGEEGQQTTYLLPYAELRGIQGDGIALEHSKFTDALRESVLGRPGVELWDKSRVTAISQNDAHGVEAVVEHEGAEVRVRAKLLVAADGRASTVRRMAGIEEHKTRLSTMAGYIVDSDMLPHPGFGHVFVGGPAPLLAYKISPTEARVMLDIPDGQYGIDAPKKDPAYLSALPPTLREAVRKVLLEQRATVSANFTRVPRSVTSGRVVLVGDAAGCCHPLGASGLSSCTGDALGLKRALQSNPDDMPAALKRYVALRRGAQRTRISLAGALYQAFSDHTPEMALLRRGLFRYWAQSASGRSASMGLISTHETRMHVMAREYARVVGFALPEIVKARKQDWSFNRGSKAVMGLVRSTLPYVGESVRDVLDTVGWKRASVS